MNQKLRMLSILFAGMLFSIIAIGQGVTTASMNGQVVDANAVAVTGATIVATHNPSGSTYGGFSNSEGYFRILNMRVGGPYTVKVSFPGFEDYQREGVVLNLGQSFKIDAQLAEAQVTLEEELITSSRSDVFDGNKTGQETVVGERLINDIPTISRAIGDYARQNPLASIGEGGDGFTISIAGQNNRYNAIYIDGAVNNDAFGLAGGGTNGGQTGVQPISIDAIEQFQIAVAPFDVRQSGFAGGSINAVTRSGSNEFEGSAYFFNRNQTLAGKTPTDNDDVDRERLADFSANTYGFRLGGPIVKDKVFFFVNAEVQRDETPQPFDLANYNGNSDAGTLSQLESLFQNQYGYDLKGFENNTAFLDSDKFLGKIDINISRNHKLSLRHSYVRAENLEARSSSPFSINYLNGSEFFVSTTNSSALELNSLFGENVSNSLVIGATIVRDDRDPFGDPFPTVSIADGEGTINLGAERFSTANLLNQDVITVNDNLNIYLGKHNLLFGVNFEYFSAGNLFIRNNYGRYQWFNTNADTSGLDLFLAGEPSTRYERSFSQVDNVAGDESNAIADFEQINFGFYIQDELQVTNDFKLTAGLRFDFPIWLTDQPVNQEFNTSTAAAIEAAGYDLKGAETGSFIGTQVMLSPRVGFNWDIGGKQLTQLRGGIGIFTSRIPLVWPGGAYNNYGFNIGAGGGSNVPFVADVQNQPIRANLDDVTPSGQIDLFAEDFKLPQVLKFNVAVDRKFGDGYIATLEGLFTKNVNAVRYENVNLQRNLRGNLDAGPDNRPLYFGADPNFGDDVIDDSYNYIMLASNTDKGYSYNIAATVSKLFSNGFQGSLSYSYGDAFTTFDGTSSQNNSQWRGYHPPLDLGSFNGGRNDEADPQRSTFAQGHRVFSQLSYELDYLDFGKTRFSFSFNGQTGGFFSYVIGADNFRFTDDGGFSNNELVYVPNNLSEIPLVDFDYNGRTYSAQEQWDILNAFIEDDPHLSDRRGTYAERNGGREPWEVLTDFRLLQDVYLKAGGKTHTLQFSVDIFNIANLINSDWGRVRFAGSFGNYRLIQMQNSLFGSTTAPEYTIATDLIDGEKPWDNSIDDSGFRSSRWQMQFGVRYIFQ